MKIDAALRSRLSDLQARANALQTGDRNGQAQSQQQIQECSAWLAAAQNVVHLICTSPFTPYRTRTDKICEQQHGWVINQAVGEVAAIVRALVSDADAGLVASIADQASAEIFDDFLDHASAYVADGRKNEAGVVAGVVFEDTLRRVCRKLNISEKDVNLDELISDLTRRHELSAAKAKRARAAAHVRTKATHAQWDEFELDDVRASIEFTRELIKSKLDA